MELKLQYEVNFDDPVHLILKRKSQKHLALTANGVYEINKTDRNVSKIKIDPQQFTNLICIFGYYYAVANANNGDIIILTKAGMKSKEGKLFVQAQVISRIYVKITQMEHITNDSILISGLDSRNQYKTTYWVLHEERLINTFELKHQQDIVHRILSVDGDHFTTLITDSSKDVKLLNYRIETHKNMYIISMVNIEDLNLTNKIPLLQFAFEYYVVGVNNKIICCSTKNKINETIIDTEDEDSVLCQMTPIKSCLLVFYKNGNFYQLNKQLHVVGKIFKANQNMQLERCFFPSTDSMYMVYSNQTNWQVRMYLYETFNEMLHKININTKPSTIAQSLIKLYQDLVKCPAITDEERQFSKTFFENLNTYDANNKAIIAFDGLKSYLKLFGTELLVTNTVTPNDQTLRLHVSTLFNGFLDNYPFYYKIEFESDNEELLKSKFSVENDGIYSQYYKLCINAICEIPIEEIVILSYSDNNLSFNFTFISYDDHEIFCSKKHRFDNFTQTDMDQFGLPKTRFKKVDIFPLLNECKLNLNIFDPKHEVNYAIVNNKHKIRQGGFSYESPHGWTKLGVNILVFGYKRTDDWIASDDRSGTWATGYVCFSRDKSLEHLKKLLSSNTYTPVDKILKKQKLEFLKNINKYDLDGFNKRCGHGVKLQTIVSDNEDSFDSSIIQTHSGKQIKMALMCRVDPKKVKVPELIQKENNTFLVNNPAYIRPYGFLLKI